MKKGSGTRSGLLWEIERILSECRELPQILLMENVPQVHSRENIKDFREWLRFLESIGYSNYYSDCNAKDYGIAQNRERCFCVSVLGDYVYTFPETIPLTKRIKDYLEDEVDSKYYITSDKAKELIDSLILDGYMPQIKLTGRECVDLTVNEPSIIKTCNCIMARYDAGISNFKQEGCGVVEIVAMRGRNIDNPSDRTAGTALKQRLEPNTQGICNTITSVQKDNLLLEAKKIKVRQATKQGFVKCELPGVADLNYPTSNTRRGRVQNGGAISPTLTTENIPSVIELADERLWNFVYEIDGEPNLIRIRKLTPKECGRLMGVTDSDIAKMMAVESNSQVYKAFGNSICCNVLEAIFSQMNIKGVVPWNQRSEKAC